MSPKLTFFILLSMMSLVGCGLVGRRANPTQAEVRSWIQRELSIGSNKENVLAFLQKHRINYSEVDSRIVAGLGSKKGILTRSDIQIEFRLDSQGKLASYVVTEVFTGP
jgi:hypothetical protein